MSVHALKLGPAGPASLFQQFDQPTGRWRGVEGQGVHQLDERGLDVGIVDVVLALLVGHLCDVGGQLVGQLDQQRIVVGPVESLARGRLSYERARIRGSRAVVTWRC
nr:hypothetical protein OG999_32555 [Streptomyces sp. NBC_00886]